MLDDYLELNRIGTINSRILFTDMPKYYDFDYKLKKWIAKETIEIYCIGKFNSYEYDEEDSCLQLLHQCTSGVKTRESLKKFQGKTFGTYYEALRSRRLV
jgi:hypothetical protein